MFGIKVGWEGGCGALRRATCTNVNRAARSIQIREPRIFGRHDARIKPVRREFGRIYADEFPFMRGKCIRLAYMRIASLLESV